MSAFHDPSQDSISRQDARQDSITLIHLFSIDLPNNKTMRFTGDADHPIQFSGEIYASLPVDSSGFAWNDKGAPVRPNLSIAYHDGGFDVGGNTASLIGRRLTRIATFIEECDPPHGDGGGSCFTPECWKIDRLTRLDGEKAVFGLVAEADLAGQSLPSRVMLRDLCQHRYRVWDETRKRFDYSQATCPYIGHETFDGDGKPVSLPQDDRCSLTLEKGCKKRFQKNLPFLGFPGIGGF